MSVWKQARAFSSPVRGHDSGPTGKCASRNGHGIGELQSKPPVKHIPLFGVQGDIMTYRIVAERENETVRMDRASSLIAIAKARVWASEGWDVTIVVHDQ